MTEQEELKREMYEDMKAEQAQEMQDARKYTAICEDIDNFMDYYQDQIAEFEDKWREIKDLLQQHGYTENPEDII